MPKVLFTSDAGDLHHSKLDGLWSTGYIDESVSKVEISEDGTVWIYAPDMAHPIVLPEYFTQEEVMED